MALQRGRMQFDDGGDRGRHRILASIDNGPDGNNRSVEQLARTLSAKHRDYGSVELTQDTFAKFIENFNADTYGQQIFIDVGHKPDQGAAGQIKRLYTEGDALLAEIEWTPKGVKAVKEDGFRYFSIDFHDDYEDRETGKKHGPTLFGAGLVTRPFVKRMRPTEGPGRMFFSDDGLAVPDYLKLHEAGDMNKFLKKLREKLEKLNLAEGVITQILAAFEAQAKTLGEDEKALESAYGVYETMGTKLAEEIGDREVTVKLDGLEPNPKRDDDDHGDKRKQLSDEEIDKRLAKMLDDREEKAAKEKAETERKLGEVKKQFDGILDEAKGLTDPTREDLRKEWGPMLSADMSEDQVKALADKVVKAGDQIEANKKLADMGYEFGGAGVHLQMGDEPVGQRLGETMRKNLGESAASQGRLALPEESKCSAFVRRVLSDFDRRNAQRLHDEGKRLAGDGSVNIADGDFPIGAQRQVILETLSDLRILELANTNVDPQAQATTEIPYEERQLSNVRNGGRVYEGQPINRAGVRQRMDIAYVIPRKIAMLMSNEMIHFSRTSRIDWDAWARNISSNSRLMRELVAADIANTMQRAADSYLSMDITGEDLEPQFDGSTSVVNLAQWPLVRPHQERDLQGNAVGSATHPITVTYDGNPIDEYDGTGSQSAGVYYRIASINLGQIQFVDEAGDAVTPADTTTCTIDYSYATNVVKFDLDTPSGEEREKHLNGLLHRIGRRKAMLADERFVRPEFILSSHTLNQTASEAEQFTAHGMRMGTGAGNEGDVSTMKGIPAWMTNEPGIDLGDERFILGERGTLGYTVVKAFQTGTPFEAFDSATGKPTGEKIAYGEEYSAIKVPDPVQDRLTSVIAYSATARSGA